MILVAGSTGSLGTEIVRLLRSGGESVRALVRPTSAPEKIAHLKELGAEAVVGDLKDHASLEAACRGATTVISTVTILTTAQPGDSFQDTDAAGNIALIDAAKAAGADHFIYISFNYDGFPETPLTEAKTSVEEHLKSGLLDYTIIKPPLFMEVWLGPYLFGDLTTGEVKIYGAGNGIVPYASIYDVAQVTVNAAYSPDARNRTIAFIGPDSLTQREIVSEFESVVGKPLIVTEVPEQVLEVQWQGAQNPFEKTFAGLMLGVARLDQDNMSRDEMLPDQMLTIREFAQRRASDSGLRTVD